jgi:hypothetical protein
MTILMALLLVTAGDNELSEQEKKDGWTLLFDGKSPDGWVNLKPANIEEGCINPFKSGNYVTFTKERYGNFVLNCDFKISKGCNSGVFIRTDNPKDPVQTGIEIQVFDSAGKEKPSKHDSGAIYDLVAPTKNTMKPAGEWNHIEITCDRNKIKVVLNGEAIAEMDLDQWSEAGKNPDGSKNKFTKALKDFTRDGQLGFQDHGQPCWYKNIKLKKL